MAAGGVVCYFEKQGADKLCAVHCVNALLQGPYFSEVELGRFAQELDAEERRLMQEGGIDSKDYKTFAEAGSTNVDATGNFSIGVIEATLRGYGGLRCLNIQHPDVRSDVQANPSDEVGYICNSHAREHWFTIRKVRGRWWDLDSLKHAPRGIGDAYLAELLAQTQQQGFSIFVVRGDAPLPDPSPTQFGSLQSHQHFLSEIRIEALQREGHDREAREMAEAQRIAGGGEPGGSGDGEESSAPAFTVVTPADKRKPQETNWSSLGGGQSLSGKPAAAAAGSDDAELQAALRASMLDTAAEAAEPPEEPEAGTPGICTVQVRLPTSKSCRRRFLVAEHTMDQFFAWLEHVSVQDSSLGLPVLSAYEGYAVVRRGGPGTPQAKFERAGGSVKVADEDVGAKTLKDAGFLAGQEAVHLQL